MALGLGSVDNADGALQPPVREAGRVEQARRRAGPVALAGELTDVELAGLAELGGAGVAHVRVVGPR